MNLKKLKTSPKAAFLISCRSNCKSRPVTSKLVDGGLVDGPGGPGSTPGSDESGCRS